MSWHFKFEDASSGERGSPVENTNEEAYIEPTEMQVDMQNVTAADEEAEQAATGLDEVEQYHDIVQESVNSGNGLNPVDINLVKSALKYSIGESAAKYFLSGVKTESAVGLSGKREQSRLVLLGIKETLKSAWRVIKDAFMKAWSNVKTFYIKTFDSSKRLKSRAEKIRDRADQSSSTIDDKNFKFSGVSTLHIGGKLKEYTAFKGGMELVRRLSEDILSVAKSSRVDSAVDALETALDSHLSHTSGGNTNKNYSQVISAVNTATEVIADYSNINGDNAITDSKIQASLKGGDTEVKIVGTAELPGGKQIAKTSVEPGKDPDIEKLMKSLRKSRVVMVNTKDKPKEISSDAEAATLNNAQISEIADIVAQIADNIFDFKKGWENRDKLTNNLVKELDRKFNDVAKDVEDDDDATDGQKTAKELRSFASAVTGYVRRHSTFLSAFVSYAMTVGGASLTYCEESFRHHK